MQEIVLIRHGRPALSRNVRLSAKGYRDWWTRYDTVGLWEGQTPPPKVLELVQGADVVASSTLPRAVATAELALTHAEHTSATPHLQLPEMVEAPLPPPPLGPLKFRPLTWGTLSRILWLMGRADNGESARAARARAGQAAERLETLSPEGRTVVFAHGWFNRMVGRQLRQRGWICVSANGDGYWSHRVFRRPDTVAVNRPTPASASRVSEA